MNKKKIIAAAAACIFVVSSSLVYGQPAGEPPAKPPGEGGAGMSGEPESYNAVKKISKDITLSGEKISSSDNDENALLVEKNTATIKESTISRKSSGSSGGDSASFYGVGSALLATGGKLLIGESIIETDSKGGAGAFSYNEGEVYLADTKITTKQDASGGIHAAGGGKLYAWNLDVTTEGESSAAIRSDRGGGTMVIDGGSYTSHGSGSPAIYCTADVSVKDAELSATGSEAFCMEGFNRTRLYDCTLKGDMKDDKQNDTTWTVIVYQSMSGDAEEGCGTFEMDGGSIESENGGIFYTTNTESNFVLKNVKIIKAKDSEFFLRCTGNENARGWGTPGSNGADCTFTGISQKMNGDILWDRTSRLSLYMTEASSLTGAVKVDETLKGDAGSCDVYVTEDSRWVVTGDSTISNLYAAGEITDADGKTIKVVSPEGKILKEGDGKYTITADSYHLKTVMKGKGSLSSFSDGAVEKPEALIKELTAEEFSSAVPEIVKTDEGLQVCVEEDAYMDGIEIRRSPFASIGYFLFEDEEESELYEDQKAKNGHAYYYKVRSYMEVDGEKIYSAWSEPKKIAY